MPRFAISVDLSCLVAKSDLEDLEEMRNLSVCDATHTLDVRGNLGPSKTATVAKSC